MNLDQDGFLTTDKAVALKPYKARPFRPYETMSEEEIRSQAGGYLVVDTENYANYFLIAFKNITTNKYFFLESPFNPHLLSWIMHSYTTIGFNTIKYDLSLIWLSYYDQDLAKLKTASNELINGIWERDFTEKYKIQIFGTSHVDLINVCPLRGSLKLYSGRLHGQRIQDVPFDPYGSITEEEKLIVKNYCVNDLDSTELLLNNLSEQLSLRQDLSNQYRQNLMSKSDAQIAEAVITSEIKRLTGSYPKKPKIEDIQTHFYFKPPANLFFQTDYLKGILHNVCNTKFSLDGNGRLERGTAIANLSITIGKSVYRMGIGGLHSSEECIGYTSNEEYEIRDRDVASFYPRIVLNCGLYPSHIGPPFLEVYNSLVDRRLAAKKAKQIAQSENLKVTINGTFGKTGSPYSVIYAPEMTIQITVGGQLYLLMFIEAMELEGIQVISANTDGIVMYLRKDQIETYERIVKWWEQTTGFETEETKYKCIYSRDVNAYLAVGEDGKVKGKNVLYDPWRGTSAKDAYWRFQKNPNMQICVEAVEMLITKNEPIEKTIKDCKDFTKFVIVRNVKGGAHKDREYLGKTIRWYYATNELGTINYIVSGNKVPDSEGAKPAMDLPEVFPSDINYQVYIDKAIELCYDIGFLKKAVQQSLF